MKLQDSIDSCFCRLRPAGLPTSPAVERLLSSRAAPCDTSSLRKPPSGPALCPAGGPGSQAGQAQPRGSPAARQRRRGVTPLSNCSGSSCRARGGCGSSGGFTRPDQHAPGTHVCDLPGKQRRHSMPALPLLAAAHNRRLSSGVLFSPCCSCLPRHPHPPALRDDVGQHGFLPAPPPAALSFLTSLIPAACRRCWWPRTTCTRATTRSAGSAWPAGWARASASAPPAGAPRCQLAYHSGTGSSLIARLRPLSFLVLLNGTGARPLPLPHVRLIAASSRGRRWLAGSRGLQRRCGHTRWTTSSR